MGAAVHPHGMTMPLPIALPSNLTGLANHLGAKSDPPRQRRKRRWLRE
jgi:hypothetical protein